jgi:hypothetical protein
MTTMPRRRARVAVYSHSVFANRAALNAEADRLLTLLRTHMAANVKVEEAGRYFDVGVGERVELRRLVRDAHSMAIALVLIPRWDVLGKTPPEAVQPLEDLLAAGALTLTEEMIVEWAPDLTHTGELEVEA